MTGLGDCTAILVVNGGQEPPEGSWITLCVDKIREHTPAGSYRIYVWNNNTGDPVVARFFAFASDCVLVDRPPDVELIHPHSDPLQRLYEQARADGARVIVAMDSDAHPVRAGWLEHLVDALDGGAVLTGAWRDELSTAIDPYVHASCLATTVDFVEQHQLRFDRLPATVDGRNSDTLSHFTDAAEAAGGEIARLERSNGAEFHRLIGGVYGDAVYHHGAGSRRMIRFWDEPDDEALMRRNARIGRIGAHLLFTGYDGYMSWLRGHETDPGTADAMERLAAGRLDTFEHVGEPQSRLDGLRSTPIGTFLARVRRGVRRRR